jgi:hypothetical protein
MKKQYEYKTLLKKLKKLIQYINLLRKYIIALKKYLYKTRLTLKSRKKYNKDTKTKIIKAPFNIKE